MRRLIVVSVSSAILAVSLVAFPAVAGGGGSPLDQILALLRDPDFGLAEIKREVRAIEAAVTAPPPPSGPMRLSSGLFGLPAAAQSVDWTVVNDSTTSQTFTVTVYEAGVGPKTVVAPGPLTLTIAAGEVTHNANSVSFAGPFRPGFYYEIILPTTSPNVLPTATIWEAHVATIIPGTTISPGTWVRLQ
jgi:hypothetical protein